MGKLFANGARIRRNNEQERVDPLLADAERQLNDVFSKDSHYRFDRDRLYQCGQSALRHTASARLIIGTDYTTEDCPEARRGANRTAVSDIKRGSTDREGSATMPVLWLLNRGKVGNKSF